MSSFTIDDLVSQADKSGVTLAEIITNTMSLKDMDHLQNVLNMQIATNYETIRDFMSDVEVPSLAELSQFTDDELLDMEREVSQSMSDELSSA